MSLRADGTDASYKLCRRSASSFEKLIATTTDKDVHPTAKIIFPSVLCPKNHYDYYYYLYIFIFDR